jgi:methionine--tRNA ligase beta chain
MTTAPIKPQIDPAVLERIDVRVGSIESVSFIEGADKLVQLRVDFGDHKRTIVAALKLERANPREIEGKQALFVVNLAPRKMRGVLSEGMLFDIGYADGVTPVLAVPESPVPAGTRAG